MRTGLWSLRAVLVTPIERTVQLLTMKIQAIAYRDPTELQALIVVVDWIYAGRPTVRRAEK